MKKSTAIIICLSITLAIVLIIGIDIVLYGNQDDITSIPTTDTSTTTYPEEPSEDIVEVIDGYVWVNGINTGIKAEQCDHFWQTVTTPATCTTGGYDTVTCTICDKTYIDNETTANGHKYRGEYETDDNYHWGFCSRCEEMTTKEYHSTNDDGVCTVCAVPLGVTPGVVYDVSSDGTYAEVIGYVGTSKSIKLASEYNGLPVKTIYAEVFKENYDITYVVIPEGVISIGDSAFYDCENLKSVVIPSSVTSIGYQAFLGCSSLKSIEIPNSVTSIGGSAFSGCSSLESIEIPNAVTSIGNYAFNNCKNLTSVVIPDSVTSIGVDAFNNCQSSLYAEYKYGKYVGNSGNPYAILVELATNNLSTYEIHPDTKIIAGGVFQDCARLSSITIPEGVKGIGYQAFYNCDKLTSIIMPNSVKSISDYAFSSCDMLTSVVIPDSVTIIGQYAFYDCENIESVIIGKSVKSIGERAFCDCSKLTSVVMHNNVKNVDYAAFGNCTKLRYVYYTGTREEWENIEFDEGANGYIMYSSSIQYNYVPG